MQKGSAPIILVMVILIGALAAGGGYYLGTQKPRSIQQSITAIPTLTPISPVPTVDPTANWKIYTNDKFKISFKYPNFYTITESGGSGVFLTKTSEEKEGLEECFNKKQPECNDYSLSINFDNPERNPSIDLGSFVRLYTHTSSSGFMQITLDGYPALQEQFEGIGLVNNIFVDRGKTILYIQANSTINPKENMANFDQILSTFKFIDQAISPTPSCMPRPKCLDATPRCLIPEPVDGWCK